MIPLTFLDGAAVWLWSRLAWVLIFGITTFLFWQLVINQYAAYLDAFQQPTIVAILVILGVYGSLTAGTWLYFRNRHAHDGEADSGGPGLVADAPQDAGA
jgi:hypothetical protein